MASKFSNSIKDDKEIGHSSAACISLNCNSKNMDHVKKKQTHHFFEAG